LEASVMGVDALGEVEIWNMAKKYAVPQSRSLKGRADILSSALIEIGLDFSDDDQMEGRHSNVVQWSMERETQLEQAMELAKASTFQPYNDGKTGR
jgi:hypothetical protein